MIEKIYIMRNKKNDKEILAKDISVKLVDGKTAEALLNRMGKPNDLGVNIGAKNGQN